MQGPLSQRDAVERGLRLGDATTEPEQGQAHRTAAEKLAAIHTCLHAAVLLGNAYLIEDDDALLTEIEAQMDCRQLARVEARISSNEGCQR